MKHAIKILVVFAIIAVAGCASKPKLSPAKLECTGVCSVGSKQASSKCKAQAVQSRSFSSTNTWTGETSVHSNAYVHDGVFKACMNGEGWEYLSCFNEQEAGCRPVREHWISDE